MRRIQYRLSSVHIWSDFCSLEPVSSGRLQLAGLNNLAKCEPSDPESQTSHSILIREHCTADLLDIPVYSLRSISQYKLVGQLTSSVLLFFLWTVRHEVLVLYSRLNGYIQIYPNILGSILQNISKYEIRSRKQIRSRVTLLKSSFHNNLTSFSFLKVALIFEQFSKSLLLRCEG